MNQKFLSFLRCPKDGEELNLSIFEKFDNGMIKSGKLKCSKDKTHIFPIINGIPRFVNKEFYTSSFGYEWKKWPRLQFESENTGKQMEGYTLNMFKAITHFNEEVIKGKTILEYGCGSGRFIELIRLWGGIVIGIDLSLAVESARKNFQDDENVLIIQADILKPPLKKESFDLGYTVGVLHHTKSPETAFKKICSLIKKGGLIACTVYPKYGFYDSPAALLFRKTINTIKKLFNEEFGNKIALYYSFFASTVLYPILSRLKRFPLIGKKLVSTIEYRFLVNVYLKDKKWRMLDIFDAITPFYASTHTSREVIEWFKKTNCYEIIGVEWSPTSYVGRKR